MIKLSDGIFYIDGKIDSTNAGQLETELFALYDGGKAVIDTEKLEYISSAGLRVLLKLRKKAGEVSIINVNSTVYEILEITGFTEMLEVKKGLRFVSIEGLQLIGRGGHGNVYKLSDDMIIKTYHDNSSIDMIEDERRFGKNAFVSGIPCAIAFDVVKCEDGYGVVFEMAGAVSLAKFLMENPDKISEYGVKYAELLKTINSLSADTALYGNIKDIFIKRTQSAAEYFTPEENKILIDMFNAIPDRMTMVHGDYHPGNVMVTGDGELLLIDMADVSYGNPIFDIGGTYLIMVLAGQNNPDIVKTATGLDFELSVQLWNTLLSAYYGTTDPQKLGLITQRFIAFSLLRMAASLGMRTEGAVKLASGMVAMLRKNLFPNAETFTKLLQMDM